MRIAIVGSRTLFPSKKEIARRLLTFVGAGYDPRGVVIVSGGASGVDKCAEDFALENGMQAEIFVPDWEKYGKKAGIMRNKAIVESSNAVLVFWDGESKGTLSSIRLARDSGIPCVVIVMKPAGIMRSPRGGREKELEERTIKLEEYIRWKNQSKK